MPNCFGASTENSEDEQPRERSCVIKPGQCPQIPFLPETMRPPQSRVCLSVKRRLRKLAHCRCSRARSSRNFPSPSGSLRASAAPLPHACPHETRQSPASDCFCRPYQQPATIPYGAPSNKNRRYRPGRAGLLRGIHIADTHWPLQWAGSFLTVRADQLRPLTFRVQSLAENSLHSIEKDRRLDECHHL